MRIEDDRTGQDDREREDRKLARARVHPRPQLPTDHVGASGAHQDGQVDEDDRAQRVKHVSAGIQHRREDQHAAAREASPEIQARQQEDNPQRHAREAARCPFRRQEKQEGQQDGGDGDPQHRRGVPPGSRQRLQQDLELRPSLHRHDGAAADGERPDGIAPRHKTPTVEPEHAASRHVASDLQAGQHADIALADPFGQVPARAEAMEAQRIRDLQERRFRRKTRIRHERHVHPPGDVVVGHREFMTPGLQRVVAIAVQHEILRQPLERHPVRRILRQRLERVAVQLRRPAVQDTLHAARLPGGVARRPRVAQRGNEQHHPRHERGHGEPFPTMSSPSHS